MNHVIVGTAGHVDHGKTALVKRLTGIDTDRLKEEKERGVSIELGFAPLHLKNGRTLSIIDVPGHERFIKNMLIGASGMDFALLIIAADDGIMPQTREHMDILKLLDVKHGIVVITKIDLVDSEWLEMVKEDVSKYLADTPFATVPLICVSSTTGEGLDKLIEVLEKETEIVKERTKGDDFRLAVDRLFSKAGFGTVVTGTLWEGQIKIGDKIEVFPGGATARVRNLQVHGEPREEAFAGERVAINLAGTDKDQIQKGSWVASPNLLKETFRIDVELNLLSSSPVMTQHSRVHVYHGAMSVLARINFLDREELNGGEKCFAQLTLEEPLSPLAGDHLVVRFYSPLITIGGAAVIDINPQKHKRYNDITLQNLYLQAYGNKEDILLQSMLDSDRIWSDSDIASYFKTAKIEMPSGFFDSEDLIRMSTTSFISKQQEEKWRTLLNGTLEKYYANYPLRRSIGKEEIYSRVFCTCSHKDFIALLEFWKTGSLFIIEDKTISLSGFSPRPTEVQKHLRETIINELEENPYAPPGQKEIAEKYNISPQAQEELANWLIDDGIVIRLGEDAFMLKSKIDDAEELIREKSLNSEFTLANVRDWLLTSRKYALLIVDHLENQKKTARHGDFHVWL